MGGYCRRGELVTDLLLLLLLRISIMYVALLLIVLHGLVIPSRPSKLHGIMQPNQFLSICASLDKKNYGSRYEPKRSQTFW
jgi:hypothetical protein